MKAMEYYHPDIPDVLLMVYHHYAFEYKGALGSIYS